MTAKSYFAIREDGKKIILDDETMTWELEQSESLDISNINVPSEKDLYSIALRERAEMSEVYLDTYEGRNLNHTITILFNWHLSLDLSTNSFNSEETRELRKEIIMKGIQYTYQYGLIKSMEMGYPNNYASQLSNLYFFWEYADLLENEEKDYEGALYWYMELKKLYSENNEKYRYSMLENSLDQINSKIFMMEYNKKSES